MDMSPYLENKLNDHVLKATTYTAPAAVYVALYNGDPLGAGTEVTTTIRPAGRVAATFAASASGVSETSADVDFGDADAGATVSYVAIMDAASSGNILYRGALTGGSQAITAGNAVKINSTELSVTLD